MKPESITIKNLESAFAGESMAHIKYRYFARIARAQGDEATAKVFECIVCGYVYDEAAGDPEHGIAAGTRWENVPSGWACPECGIAKEDFEMVLLAA